MALSAASAIIAMAMTLIGFFMRLGEQLMREEFGDQQAQIVFRVKPAADGPDYREQFLREIAPRLDTDNIFVADAEPYTQMQAQFEVMYGDTDKVNKSDNSWVLFLLGNVFLGLIGTFCSYAPSSLGNSLTVGYG